MTVNRLEAGIYHPEVEKDVEHIKIEIYAIVESLINKPEHFVGEGTTAEVYKDSLNPKICYKVLRETYDRFVNSSRKEMDLQERAERVNGDDCRVATPIAWFKVAVPELNNDKDYLGEVQIVVMETLDAVTLHDVIGGKHSLPEKYNHGEFFTGLKRFVNDMHNKENIHHRDLKDTNIMIDLETGKPRVIDFGAAISTAAMDEEQNPYRQPLNGGFQELSRDIPQIESLQKTMSSLLNTKKTV